MTSRQRDSWRAALSPRERQVALRLARGKRVSEVADALGVSVKTISTYRVRILHKLGLRTTAELMVTVVKEDLQRQFARAEPITQFFREVVRRR